MGLWYTNISISFWWTPPVTGATELYDGSTWTSNPTGLNTARYAWQELEHKLQV
jgi:hypothetical protein